MASATDCFVGRDTVAIRRFMEVPSHSGSWPFPSGVALPWHLSHEFFVGQRRFLSGHLASRLKYSSTHQERLSSEVLPRAATLPYRLIKTSNLSSKSAASASLPSRLQSARREHRPVRIRRRPGDQLPDRRQSIPHRPISCSRELNCLDSRSLRRSARARDASRSDSIDPERALALLNGASSDFQRPTYSVGSELILRRQQRLALAAATMYIIALSISLMRKGFVGLIVQIGPNLGKLKSPTLGILWEYFPRKTKRRPQRCDDHHSHDGVAF